MLHLILGGPPPRMKPVQNYLPRTNESASSPSDDESRPMIAANHTPDVAAPPSLALAPAPAVGAPLPSWVPTYAYQREGREVCPIDPSRDTNGYLFEGWEAVPPFSFNEVSPASAHGRSANIMNAIYSL